MKKLFTILFILCFGILSGNAFGQDKKTQEKKGGFSVGGYDNTRQEQQAPATKRSVVIPEEAPAEKAAEEVIAEPVAAPAPAMAPPATEVKPQNDAQGNASGKDKQKEKKAKSKGKVKNK